MKINLQETSSVKFSIPLQKIQGHVLSPQEKLLRQHEASKEFLFGSILIAIAGISGWLAIALGIIGTSSLYEGLSASPLHEVVLPMIIPAIFLIIFSLLLVWIAKKKQHVISRNLSEIVASDTTLIRKHFSQKRPETLPCEEISDFIYKNILTGNKNRSYQLSLLRHIHTNFTKENSAPLDKKIADQIKDIMEHFDSKRE
ncbi:hypothetical protein [Chlamydiifrater phoenicopteri]|uniref:hypothetical protein n=1 Tax=Chlamydiifrater phoenicopteri TaxID=2681469 RepID=UPI001BCC4746|nr:hypothetical protein [Chlamydiifrater phoenicopteri]